MSPPTEDRAAALQRRPTEKPQQHRGFLLWVMQAPAKRSARAVARALGRDPATVRYWSETHAWEARLAALEPATAEADAQGLFRVAYLSPATMPEIAAIERYLAAPFAVHAAVSATAADAAAAIAQQAAAEAVADPGRAGEEDRRRKFREQARQVAQGAMDQLVDAAVKKTLKVSLRDVTDLVELLDRLDRDAMPAPVAGGPVLVETVRVRQAREGGGNLLDALDADLAELSLIVRVLRDAERHAASAAEPASGEASAG